MRGETNIEESYEGFQGIKMPFMNKWVRLE